MASVWFIVFTIFMVFLAKSTLALIDCNVPPQFWCDNPEISAHCDVTEQCKGLKLHNGKAVEFTLYYESMCPDCKDFFKSQLVPAYQKVGSIMNLTLVPYGNARHHYDGDLPFKYWFECQHGIEECVGNMLETCSIGMYNNVSVFFPFISCVEKSALIPRKAAVECAREHKLNYDKIMSCVNSYQGRVLEYAMAEQTDALQPPHQYVPWVTLNGVHTEQIQNMAQQDLVKLICTTYTGSPKPPACS